MDSATKLGYAQAATAYGLWGLFPLYFLLFAHLPASEVVAHRVLWSWITCMLLLALTGGLRELLKAIRDRRLIWQLTAASVLICVNWLTYVYAVASGRTLDAALGYFINPLSTTALGVIVLRERLRPLQWLGVALGAGALLVLVVGYGKLPWIALTLALSFGGYALAKKLISRGTTALTGMAIETGVLAPLALGYLLLLTFQAQAAQPVFSLQTLQLASTGLVTVVPLLLFAASTAKLPLVAIGMLQYLAPMIQFLLGWLVLGEAMPAVRWLGFGLVWAAVIVFIVDGLIAAGILGECAS